MFVLKYRIIQVGFGIRLDLRRLPGAGSRVRSLILHEDGGMSAGSFSRTAAGNRAHFGTVSSKMDVPTLMYNLKEEVSCSVCMQLYTNPKQLPCLHIFCLECLNNLARTSARSGKIKCPLCQREVDIPESGTLDTLPNCFHMKNLLDILAIKECDTAKVTCGNCEIKREEASYCFHCGKFWCNDCVNAHNILRENREHRVLALKDFKDKDFEDVLKRPVFCPKELHDKEILKFYCKECDIPVCQTCVIVDHNKHDVEHMEVAAREVKKSITSKLAAARESSNAISCNYNTGEKERKSRLIDDCSNNNKERIRQTVESLISILHQKEQELIAEVENERKIAQEELRKTADAFQNFLRKRERSISNIEALVERSTGADLVRRSTKENIDELFQGLQEQQDMPSTTERKVYSKVFVKNEAVSTVLEESVIGRLEQSVTEAKQCFIHTFTSATAGLATETEVITRNSEGEQYYCAGDYITVQLISVNQDLNSNCIAEEVKIVDWQNGRYTVSYIPSESGQHLLTVQVNGEYITKFLPVEIKERCFKPLEFIGERAIEGRKMRKPWGITANDSNEIFSSDMRNQRIVVFNENGEFIRSFGQNTLKCPNGVVFDNKGRIFVGNRDDNKILVFGQNGEYISTFHNGSSLSEPRGISFDAAGNLIVCDAGNKCVRFFSPDGSIFKTIGSGRLCMPIDCVCHNSKVFVSDREANLIKVYNNNGRFLYEFGTYGTGDGELNHPTGLAVDKMGHLLVCSLDNHRVQVFTLDGKFVAKFGEYGKELGQMNSPSSVSVLKSGRIVVCEFENNRLQIFE